MMIDALIRVRVAVALLLYATGILWLTGGHDWTWVNAAATGIGMLGFALLVVSAQHERW